MAAWSHLPVTKLSVFSRRDFSPQISWFLHLDKLNVRFGWQVEFFVLECVMFFFLVHTWKKKKEKRKKAIKMFYSRVFVAVAGQRIHSCCTFFPVGCMRGQWMHWAKIACDSDEFCSYSSVLGLFYPAGYSLVLLSCFGREAHSSSSSGSGKNNKGERLPPYGISDQEKRGSVAGLFDVRFNQ